jgi:hypothetical protein
MPALQIVLGRPQLASWTISIFLVRQKERSWYQFMRANIFGQIPLLDSSCLITGNELSLIRMNTNIVD